MQKFAVFDIDGTLIRWQLFHAIVHQLGKQGLIDATTHQTIKDARMLWKNRSNSESFKQYERILVDTYTDSLTRISPDDYHTVVDAVFDEYKDQLYVYTRDLLTTLKQDGYLLFAISGSQDEIVQKLATYHGFDDAVGAKLEVVDGVYSGTVTSPIHAKDKVLDTLVAKHNASYSESIAVGDSASDIAMLAAVEQPIAFNPEFALFEHAKDQKWRIVVERKNVVYELNPQNGIYSLKA